MTRIIRNLTIAAPLTLLALQAIRPDTTNPAIDPAKNTLAGGKMDPRVADILRRACADCHSHETHWPWYSRVSPVSWFMIKHIKDGRAKLNLSMTGQLEQDQREEILDSVAKRKMPISSYLLMHPDARLTTEDQKTLEAWVDGKLAQAESQ